MKIDTNAGIEATELKDLCWYILSSSDGIICLVDEIKLTCYCIHLIYISSILYYYINFKARNLMHIWQAIHYSAY